MKLLILSILTGLTTYFSSINNNDYTIVKEIQETNLQESVKRGEGIYKDFCMRCHKENGEGHRKFYPPLANSDWLVNKRMESIRAVKYGLKGAITVNGVPFKRSMSSPGLENQEIVDVMNYIMNNWGNKQEKMVTLEEVDNSINTK